MKPSIDSDCSVGLEFFDFLEQSKKTTIRIDGCSNENKEWCTAYISGVHRWKNEYKKRVYAKIQTLNSWYANHRSAVTLITFTTIQRGLEKHEQIDFLKECFNKSKKILNKYLGKFSYVWVMEAHKSGYSHIHLIIFQSIPKKLRKKIKKIWNEKYKAGGFSNAVHFKIRKAQRKLDSAAAYVFYYVSKTLKTEEFKSVDSGYYKQSSWVWKMSRRNSPYTGVRLWGSSRDITEVMKNSDKEKNVMWWRTNYRLPNSDEWFPLWIDEDMGGYPERISEFDKLLKENKIQIYKNPHG